MTAGADCAQPPAQRTHAPLSLHRSAAEADAACRHPSGQWNRSIVANEAKQTKRSAARTRIAVRCSHSIPECLRTAIRAPSNGSVADSVCLTISRATLIFVKETQNITLALPRTLLKRAKRVAADRDTSVSALLADALARTVDEVEGYAAAKRRHVAGLGKTADLGTGGRATWTRASLHDR